MVDLNIYSNEFNIRQSFLKNLATFLDPNNSYGGSIPDITQTLRDKVFLCAVDELSSFPDEVKSSECIVVSSHYIDSEGRRARFGGSTTSYIRFFEVEIKFRPTMEILDRDIVKNRIILNIPVNGNLSFWDTKNSTTFSNWESVAGLYVHEFLQLPMGELEDGYFVQKYGWSLYYRRT